MQAMKMAKLTVRTETPVVLAAQQHAGVMTASQEYFSGSLLRGALASLYLRRNHSEHPEKDELFRRMFLGGLRFVDAYPQTDKGTAFPLPLSLVKDKITKKVRDMLYDEFAPGFKSLKGLGFNQGDALYIVAVHKDVALHMSRRSVNERISGKSEQGNIYNYESLRAGQYFEGSVIGSEDDLRLLREKLFAGGGLTAYLGRSRYTEYGKTELSLGEIQDIPVPEADGQVLALRCQTPLLRAGGLLTDACALLREVAAELSAGTGLPLSLEADKISAAQVQLDNFVGAWQMRRPRQNALQAGSVFMLRLEEGNWNAENLQKLAQALAAGCGDRCDEGFGQLRVWSRYGFAERKDCLQGELYPDRLAVQEIRTPEVRRRAAGIVLRHISRQIRSLAYEDSQRLQGIEGKTHLFSELESLLGPREELEGAKKRFLYNLRNRTEGKEQSVLSKDLKSPGLLLYGRSLGTIFEDDRNMPYVGRDLLAEFADGNAQDFLREIGFSLEEQTGGTIFYDYWLWFFRHARKRAALSRKEG